MADVNVIVEQVAQQVNVYDQPIVQPDATPYLAPDGSPCTIGVIGSESREFRRTQRAIRKRQFERGREAVTTGEDLPEAEAADLEEADRIELAASAVKRWHGWTGGEAQLPCEPKYVKKLLSADYILAQVEQGIYGPAGFFGRVSGDSSNASSTKAA